MPCCTACTARTARTPAGTWSDNTNRPCPTPCQVVKASQLRQPAAQPALPAAAGNRGAAPPPAGPMDVDVPKSPQGRRGRGGARKQPASPTAAQPLSPTSPSAADAAAAALAAAADRGGGEASTSGRELVPLPDQLQHAVDAAMASGGADLERSGPALGEQGQRLVPMRAEPSPDQQALFVRLPWANHATSSAPCNALIVRPPRPLACLQTSCAQTRSSAAKSIERWLGSFWRSRCAPWLGWHVWQGSVAALVWAWDGSVTGGAAASAAAHAVDCCCGLM